VASLFLFLFLFPWPFLVATPQLYDSTTPSTESSRNFSINTRDPNGMIENHLFLGHDKFECLSAGFRINDTNGRSLFSVNRNEVTIGAHSLRIDGEGGAVFRESVQTPHVRAEPGRELR